MDDICNEPGEVVIPWGLLIEILSWLAVKTLVRLMCVSRSWKSLISSDKAFAKLQFERSPKHKHVIISLEEEEEDRAYFISRPLLRVLEEPSSMIHQDNCIRFKADFGVIGSCNGLVCFCTSVNVYGYRFRLCNPATRLMFDESPILYRPVSFEFLHFGFGYDDLRDTYKVVMVFSELPILRKPRTVTMVHCIGDSSWREVSCILDFPVLPHRNGLFVGGCLNWFAHYEFNHTNHLRDNDTLQQFVIVSFDMRHETYKFLSLPEGTIDNMPHVGKHLVVLRNCLCLFHDHQGTHFVVWQMREYGVPQSWTQLVNVSYQHLRCEGSLFPMWLICLCGDDDIIMALKNQDLVIIYNLSDHSVKHVQLPNIKLRLGAVSYLESLVSPC